MGLAEDRDRLAKIAVEMDSLTRDVGPKLIRLAHLRTEARAIIKELEGVVQKDA